MGRCPLRASQRLALGELAGRLGVARLAVRCGTNESDLQSTIDGNTAPLLSVRSNIISELIRAGLIGRAVGDYSDPHGPSSKEALEEIGSARDQRRYAGSLASDGDRAEGAAAHDRAGLSPIDRGGRNGGWGEIPIR